MAGPLKKGPSFADTLIRLAADPLRLWSIQKLLGFEEKNPFYQLLFRVSLCWLIISIFNGLREDTHKKSCFFSGRTIKGVGRVNLPDHSAKKSRII